MALAWVERSETGDQQVFKVEAGGNRYFELFLTTEPELMQPRLASGRGPDNFYSSRQEQGKLLPLSNGQALFPLPEIVQRRLAGSDVYYMVKTFRNEQGDGPALSPVMRGTDGKIVMSEVDPTEGVMRTLDYERVLAEIGQRGNGFSGRPQSAGPNRRTRKAAPAGTAPVARAASAATPIRQMRTRQAEIDGLALICRRLQAMSAADPAIPGRPSFSDVAAIVTRALAHVQTPDPRGTAGVVTAASVLTGGVRGQTHAAASQAELHRAVMRAHGRLRHNNGYSKAADFGISAILATLGPVLLQSLPALLPVIMPAIQGLLQNVLPKVKSASETSTTPTTPAAPAPAMDVAAIQQFLKALIPSAAAAPAPGGATQTPAGTAAPAAGGTAAPQTTPEQLMALLGALQGAGGAGGGLAQPGAGGTGAAILKEVVSKLPIAEMFNGLAWIPKSSHDEWIRTLPWDKVLSLSDPAATIGALMVPGRAELQPLKDVKLSIVNRTMTRVDGGRESWIFVADRPAQLQLEIVAGPSGLERPFVDVRVSVDGTARGGIQRSVFRLQTMAAGERRVVPVELPANVLLRAPTDGRETCVSLRVIEQRGDDYAATEARCCFYVVLPHSLVIDPGAVMRAAPRLAGLPGLELTVSPLALNPTPRMLEWTIRTGSSTEVTANARYLPIQLRLNGQDAILSGGLEFSPAGLADLARRVDVSLGIDGFTALTAAINANLVLRERMALTLREPIDVVASGRSSGSLRVRVEMGYLSATLVTFSGVGLDGNPTRREVREIPLPFPRGITVHAG